MLKLLNKLLLTVVIFSSLICGIIGQPAYSAKGIPVMTDETAQDLTLDTNSSKVRDLDIEPLNTDKFKKEVVPDTKKESKKLIGLFVKMMCLVAFSAIILYLILFFVKRFNRSSFVPSDEEYENAEMLELITPENKTEALRSFLNRTK